MKINTKNYWSKGSGFYLPRLSLFDCLLIKLEICHFMEYRAGSKAISDFTKEQLKK